ncbi:MAG: toxin-antitoxin system YwqK family antitoxin [Vicinamibacteria bacterium]
MIIALGLAALAAVAHAETFSVRGGCRDGYAHGVYELRDAAGKLRAQGAFNRGARTSSFIYWTSSGIRVAHIPYDDGVVSGTVALWYSQTLPGRESRQKLEAAYAKGQRHGPTRSWFPNGRPRGEYGYENGALVSAKAWNAVGVVLGDEDARTQAARDASEDAKYYASLDVIVEANLPACEPAAIGNGTKS